MRGTGRLLQTWWDSRSRKTMIQFEVAGDILPDCEKLGAKELDIRAYPVSKKKSLDAVRYAWKLIDLIAAAVKSDRDTVYHNALRDYGVMYLAPVRPDAVESFDRMWRSSNHGFCEPTGDRPGIDADGRETTYTYLACYFGCHSYDSKEMSRLIDGLVYEAKQLGIETLPPAEIERMKELWKEKYGEE